MDLMAYSLEYQRVDRWRMSGLHIPDSNRKYHHPSDKKQSQVVPGTPFCDISKVWWRRCRSRSSTILPHGTFWRNGSWFLSADSQLPAEVGCHKLYLCERSTGGHRWACNTHTHTRTHTHTHENKSFRTTDSPPTEEAKKTGKLVWAPLEVKYLFEKTQ